MQTQQLINEEIDFEKMKDDLRIIQNFLLLILKEKDPVKYCQIIDKANNRESPTEGTNTNLEEK
ncbi:MAG TPA: hypothetical protein P5277_04355 [Candidatus Paceibacterota bacterium]|nr:hypothetical protein [Candidatus Paceibacterota bacterium]